MKGNKWVLLVVVVLALFAVACGTDDDDDDDDDNVTDDDDDDDGDNTIIPKPETCDPECGDREYCYKGFCETMKCPSQCYPTTEEPNPCPDGYVCEKQRDDDGKTDLSYCVKEECDDDFDCNGGECKDGQCRAPTYCVYDECTVYSCPGEPCEFGALWTGAQCRPGDSCVGANADFKCDSSSYCAENGYGESAVCDSTCNCGFSLCAAPCLSGGRCLPNPTNPADPLLPTSVSGSCMCMPESAGGGGWGGGGGSTGETSGFMGPCTMGSDEGEIHPGKTCASNLLCIGNTGQGSCTTHADCAVAFGVEDAPELAYCSADGTCGFSMCVGECDADWYCGTYDGQESGQLVINNGTYCTCAAPPMIAEWGDRQTGESCDTGDNKCAANHTCKGGTSTYQCEQDSDCQSTGFDTDNNQYGPNGFCDTNNHVCRWSYCAIAAKKTDMGCPEVDVDGQTVSSKPVVDGSLYCTVGAYSVDYGTRAWGETCSTENRCSEGLVCKRYTGGSIACTDNAPCQDETSGYGANGTCNTDSGKCEFTVCAKPCLDSGWCPAGTDVGVIPEFQIAVGLGTGECLCAPAPTGHPETEICDKACARDSECLSGQICYNGQCYSGAELDALAESDSSADCSDKECCTDEDCVDELGQKYIYVNCNDSWNCESTMSK